MLWCKKDGKGECLSLLKRLVGGGRKVRIETRDGLLFIDEVMRVADTDGESSVIFSGRSIAIADLERVEAVG